MFLTENVISDLSAVRKTQRLLKSIYSSIEDFSIYIEFRIQHTETASEIEFRFLSD
jgi:hypothetical protein